MRIRKNAKISPFVYPASCPNAGAIVETYVCQLNQSPWDVMSFSPPASPLPAPPLPSQITFSQANKNGICAGNGCSPDNAPVVERKSNADWKHEFSNENTTKDMEERPHDVKDEPATFCCKTDGKGWQCQRQPAKGNSLCKHHLSLAKNYNLNKSKRSKKSIVEAQGRSRPKKASASTSANPYEFYYYSGFGPSWGKRRGESSKENGGDASRNFEHDHDLNPSLLSQCDEDTRSLDDAEDESENGENRKKRGRKPIKARSLNLVTK